VNVEHFKRRLLDLERELEERLSREVETARSATPDQAAAGDLALADETKDSYFALAQTDSEILAQVRAALARIDAGTFGRCVVDGAEIEPQRLEAVPWTPYCLKHEQQLEERLPKRGPSM
jgi:DnaK suppressor protein